MALLLPAASLFNRYLRNHCSAAPDVMDRRSAHWWISCHGRHDYGTRCRQPFTLKSYEAEKQERG